MKNLKTTLLSNLIEKELFYFYKNNSFFLLDYYSVLQCIKQFLKLNLLENSLVIVTTNKQFRYLLKKYIITSYTSKNLFKIFVVNNIKDIKIKNFTVIYLDYSPNKLVYSNKNLVIVINEIKELNLYNYYKIFFQLSNLKNLVVFIALIRRLLEKN